MRQLLRGTLPLATGTEAERGDWSPLTAETRRLEDEVPRGEDDARGAGEKNASARGGQMSPWRWDLARPIGSCGAGWLGKAPGQGSVLPPPPWEGATAAPAV